MKLPLEYNQLSEYFDVLCNTADANVRNRVIERILKKHRVKSVLDLTCGTGSQVLWLAKHGYQVTGSDLSPQLIKIAKHKAKQQKIKVKLLEGDMRSTHLGRYDAVITIWNAVGHLTKTGFKKALKNIHKNLNPGGLYIFDIFNLNSMNKKVIANLSMNISKNIGHTKINHTQYSQLEKDQGRLTSFDHYSFQKDNEKPKILKNKFSLQIYTAQELRDMLTNNGFMVLGQYGVDGSQFSEKKTLEVLTVAKKLIDMER